MTLKTTKRGRFSKEEVRYVLSHAGDMRIEQIAAHLNRTIETVNEVIKNNVVPSQKVLENSGKNIDLLSPAQKAEEVKKTIIRQDLRNSEAWKNLKNEFIVEELKFFEESYIKLMSQFKNDVLASEETQILQAIKFEVLMSRNLKERRRSREDIERLEKTQNDFLKKFGNDSNNMSDSERDYLLSLETQLTQCRSGEQAKTDEYVKLQQRHESLMKSLKAVRDQRVKEIESSKVNYLGLIKYLAEKDNQEREGRQMELMKLASDKAYIDLGRPHTYADNLEDSPILSPETVDLGPEEILESEEE